MLFSFWPEKIRCSLYYNLSHHFLLLSSSILFIALWKLCIFQHLKSLPHGLCFVLGSLWEMSLRLSASLSFGAWASALVSPSVSCSSFFTWTIIWGVWTLGTMYSQSYFMSRLMHAFMAYLQDSLSITTFWNFLCAKYGWSNLLKPPLFCILPLILPKGPGTVDFASWRVPVYFRELCLFLDWAC